MAFKIVWTPKALGAYLSEVEYLEKVWTEKEVRNFVQRVEKKLELLQAFPGLGSPFEKKRNVRKTLLHKRIQLYYRVMPRKRQIELITFWNTAQNPEKLKGIK